MGEDEEASGASIASALRSHVAGEMSQEAAILKERRKAAEAREAVRTKPKGKAGGSKGE